MKQCLTSDYNLWDLNNRFFDSVNYFCVRSFASIFAVVASPRVGNHQASIIIPQLHSIFARYDLFIIFKPFNGRCRSERINEIWVLKCVNVVISLETLFVAEERSLHSYKNTIVLPLRAFITRLIEKDCWEADLSFTFKTIFRE